MIVWAVYSDVLGDVVLERLHEGFKVIFAAYFAEIFKREVAVHAGSIPVALDGLAMQFHIYAVLLTKTHHQIASGPGVVGGFLRAFGEDLEFPLAFRYFRVNAFMVDPGGQTKLPVFVDYLAGDAAHIFVANAAVIGALRSIRVAVFRKTKWTPVFKEEIFLLQANPQVGIVLDGSARVGGMRSAIRVHHFAQNDIRILAGCI